MAEELLLEPAFLSQTLRSAHETAAEAEACADEARAAALHERAAQGYVAAARRVTDGATRRAVALVANSHARRAWALRRSRGQPSQEPDGARPPPEEDRRPRAEPPPGTLCVGDVLALERRLHALGARGGGAAPELRDVRPQASSASDHRRTEVKRAAAAHVKACLGETWAEMAIDGAPSVGGGLEDDDDFDGDGDEGGDDPSYSRGRRRPPRAAPRATTPADEHARLARAVEALSAANRALTEERDALRRDNAEAAAIREEMRAFKAQYQQKFDALRERLEAFRRDYPSHVNPANATRPGDPDPPKSATDLEAENRALLQKLSAERDTGRKKDAIISRYEHWYRALKASANSKRRPSLTKQADGDR